MYAMLTGTLPFTVDPFNIKTLHAKMLKGSINKIPDNLSEDCKQLIHQFLIADPNKRITIEGALKHDWITKQSTDPLETAPFPNKLRSDDLDMTIIKHMTYKMSFRLSDVIRLVSNNIPNTSSATYHLLVRRLEKFNNREKLAATVLSAGDILEFGNSNNRKDENKNVEREEVKPPKRLTSIKNAERKLQKRRVMKANHVLGKRTESNNSDHNNNPPPNPSKSTEPKILPILPNRKSSITRASTGLSTDIVKSPKTLDERRIGTAKIFPSMTSPRTSSTSRYSSALLPRRRTSTNSYLPSISSELND
ncbi:DgyrCDS14597 [Dimorphilus gyrociliatus]|uniref:DgyrCDS14597 n=1 Tax=Dimorphilus gyrociliatus TaxID=2664684 RepID=A0A7I8WEF0_9ANNE|nr:DgyrCDS14597 [Dimorphilus gyrociliatus]